MVPYKYIAPSGIWSIKAEGRLLSVYNSTSKPPRLDRHCKIYLFFALVKVGSQNDFMISQQVIKLKEGQGDRDPCKDYDYEGYHKCLQDYVR